MNVPLGDTYYFKFTTRQFSDGVPTTLSGTPVISVYEENNLTQITAGITLTADYDSVTGLNDVAIVATSGNGYEAGKYYDAVITTGTVGGTSVVGETVKHFRIVAAENVAGVPVSDNTHVSGTSQTANDNGGDINTLVSRIVGTLAAGTHNAQSGDVFAQLPTNFSSTVISAGGAVDSLVQGFLNNLVTESTAGRLAANLSTLLDNGDAAATLTLDAIALASATASIGITKNAAFSNFEFLMVDATDFATPETGLTVTGQRSLDGGAFGAVSGTIAEVGSGIYQFDALAADTNGDVVTWKFSSAGAADRFVTFKTRS